MENQGPIKYEDWKRLSKDVALLTAKIAMINVAWEAQEQMAICYTPDLIDELFTQIQGTQEYLNNMKTA